MPIRRFLSLIAFMALLMAPFGRMAAADSMTHHSQDSMAGHCDNLQQPADDSPDKSSIDCMIACATLAPANVRSVDIFEPAPAAPEARIVPRFAGINLTADPPPPRLS